MLSIQNIDVFYGNIQALRGVSFEVGKGEIVTLIGANGAGKTTTLKAISGLVHPKNGTISFEGTDITNMPAQNIVKLRISQVPEGRRTFARMTVQENLELGAYLRKDKEGIRNSFNRVFERFPILKERQFQKAGTLSGGEQQMLAMGRALMSQPKLLLLDEPAAGMNPQETKELMEMIRWIRDKFSLSILLIEHDMGLVMGVCERIYVLEYGFCIASGTPDEIKNNKRVIEAYLGEEVS